ncbi:hypothetical protein NL676_021335 [Syzygium grande]|nr:hypothetical protein NL676_021335 [Syzygium grande]
MSYRLHPPLKGAVTSIFDTHLPTIVMSPFHRPPSSSLWRSAATIDLELRSHVRDRPWSHGCDKLWSMTASDSDLEALPRTSKDDGETFRSGTAEPWPCSATPTAKTTETR